MDTNMSKVGDVARTGEGLGANLLTGNYQELSSSIVPPRPSVVSNHILVENIGRSLLNQSFEDFTRFYKDFFGREFGSVSYIYVAKDHESWQPANVAIVTFEDQSGAQKALEASKKRLSVDLRCLKGIKGDFRQGRWERILKVSPLEETLISRVRRYVKTQRENNESEMVELENNVSKLISGEIVRETLPVNQQDWTSIDDGIQKLSDDVIRKIIETNKDTRDLVSCELVCRRWNLICQDIWFRKKELFISSTEICYQHFYGLGFNEAMFSILKRCPNLRNLEIQYLVDELTVEIIGECCPFLEKLIYDNLLMISPKFLAKCCPRLKDFCFDYGYDLTDTALRAFIREFKSMDSLKVSCYTDSVTGEPFQYLSQLRILKASSATITYRGFSNLALECHSSLRELYAGTISLHDLSVICESFRNLHTLDCCQIEEATFFDIFNNISKIEKLEKLDIDIDPNDEVFAESRPYEMEFVAFIQRRRRLKVLSLTYCEDLTDNAMCQLANYCKNLEDIRIISDKISDRSYDALSRLTSLKTLSLGGQAVTDEGVEKVLMRCPKLLYLGLDDCPLVTDRTLFTAFDLKERRLLNPQLRISFFFTEKTIKMDDLKNQQQIHDLKNMTQ